jgi:hypothetical protein
MRNVEETNLSVLKTELERPFPTELIKKRTGFGGIQLDYIEGASVIQRLNDCFNLAWSFQIVEWKLIESDIVVLGRLSAHGIQKDAFGGSKVTLSKDTNKILDLGSDIKAAATDALKKCSTLFGVGLHLYQDRPVQPKPASVPQQPAPTPPATVQECNTSKPDDNGNGRITARQLSYVFSLARDKRLDNASVKNVAFQRYNKDISFLSKGQASELIAFLKAA